MSHLQDRLAALVDGELDHHRRDRVLAHLAVCDECRREAEELRALKSCLARLPAPSVPPELTARLLALGALRPPEPPWGPASGFAARPGPARPRAGVRPRPRRAHSVRPGIGRPRAARFALAGTALVAAALGTAFAAGGSAPTSGPALAPPVESYAVEHAATASDVPFGDPAGMVVVTVSAPSGPGR